jgi:hypothetical protein
VTVSGKETFSSSDRCESYEIYCPGTTTTTTTTQVPSSVTLVLSGDLSSLTSEQRITLKNDVRTFIEGKGGSVDLVSLRSGSILAHAALSPSMTYDQINALGDAIQQDHGTLIGGYTLTDSSVNNLASTTTTRTETTVRASRSSKSKLNTGEYVAIAAGSVAGVIIVGVIIMIINKKQTFLEVMLRGDRDSSVDSPS